MIVALTFGLRGFNYAMCAPTVSTCAVQGLARRHEQAIATSAAEANVRARLG